MEAGCRCPMQFFSWAKRLVTCEKRGAQCANHLRVGQSDDRLSCRLLYAPDEGLVLSAPTGKNEIRNKPDSINHGHQPSND